MAVFLVSSAVNNFVNIIGEPTGKIVIGRFHLFKFQSNGRRDVREPLAARVGELALRTGLLASS